MKKLLILIPPLFAAAFAGYKLASYRATPARSIQPAAKETVTLTEWYYADGRINPDSVNPRKSPDLIRSPAREWIVLYNPLDAPVLATLTFFFEQNPPTSHPVQVPGRTSITVPVQDLASLVPPDLLYGVRVKSTAALVVQPSRGEYEPHNPVTHAMASLIAYPGPLGRRETRWAYADGLVLKSDSALEEWEWISILNPGTGAAKVKIRFDVAGKSITHELEVPGERLRSVDLFHLEAFPKNQLAGVTVDSDVPVVVEQVRRAYTRGVPVIASLWACLALAIGE